jgi:hypothetical protein
MTGLAHRVPEPVEDGMLVVAGIDRLAEADVSTGWADRVAPRALDARVLLQTQVWVDIRAVIHQVSSMDGTYRANVVEMLLDQEKDLMAAAVADLAVASLVGLLPASQAKAKMVALQALGNGWIERTPLVRRLRETDTLAVAGSPEERGGGDLIFAELPTSAGGLWRVTTETSIYLLDLDRPEVLRIGGAARGHHVAADGCVVLAFEFDSDGQWLPLLRIEQCRVGAALVAIQVLRGAESRIRSTPIRRIERAVPP